MRIGVHSSNLHLMLARVWPDAFAEVSPKFVFYGDGRLTAEMLASDAIDFGGTGSTPPIIAEAGGHDVVYIAASAPRPANGAIFAAKGGAIRSVADLAGRRVALVDGSFHNYLLARSLEKEGLSLRDVETLDVDPAESVPALLHGRVDAWVAMAPRLEKALRRDDLHLVTRSGSIIPNRSLFWTIAARGLDEQARDYIVGELQRIGRAVEANPRAAAEMLAATRTADADADAWEQVIRSRDFSVQPASDAVLAEQREEAETLHRHGYLGHHTDRAASPTQKEEERTIG